MSEESKNYSISHNEKTIQNKKMRSSSINSKQSKNPNEKVTDYQMNSNEM